MMTINNDVAVRDPRMEFGLATNRTKGANTQTGADTQTPKGAEKFAAVQPAKVPDPSVKTKHFDPLNANYDPLNTSHDPLKFEHPLKQELQRKLRSNDLEIKSRFDSAWLQARKTLNTI